MFKIAKPFKSDIQYLWAILVIFSLIMDLITWFSNSNYAFKNYQQICFANYGFSSTYKDCMSQFWLQYGLYQSMLIAFLILGLFSLLAFIIAYLRD